MSYYYYTKLFISNRNIHFSFVRQISKYVHKDISAAAIRQTYLDYFIKEREHAFIRSSPVIPFCDPTVPFVNAGMNQFKTIFLGSQVPHYTKVANSQKCIRVGGKHNDINIVGKDGYHHTFFEMLGNWSFGDYFKEKACEMAWELLTTVYKIPPSRLYITYFGGDDHLGLPCDIETRDIWKSLGVPNNRLLPFKAKDNFWEMGITGPCGPCTEIHFDHMGVINRHEFVNKNLHDLTEIWNLVFIQFNRLPDGSIVPLPRNHVDTGLGLERLCCALQGKLSTYNTDLFDYLIKAIHKNCSEIQKYSGKFGEQDWNEIDTSYRILADHIRMLTVCLADGVIPEQNQKLKRVLRKCFILCETVFKKDGTLVKELSNYVVENLGGVYPELERNISQIHNIIDYELEVFNTIRTTAKKDWRKFSIGRNLPNIDSLDITPSFVKAYKELYDVKLNEIDGELAYRLYDTHGFDLEAIEQLAQILNVKFDAVTFETKMEEVKLNSRAKRQLFIDDKIANLLGEGFEKTDDSFKYSYSKNKDKYQFPEVECKVLQIYNKDQSLTEIKTGSSCSLILDKTNLYFEAGGQESDKGQIKFEDGLFEVETLKKFKNYVIHKGYVKEGSIKVNTQGSLRVNEHIRLSNMRNHTCAHLLNAAVKKIRSATCQKSSKVTQNYVSFDVSVFGPKLNFQDIIAVEKLIRDIIKENLSVRILITDSQGLYSYDQITLIPGDVYPDNDIRIVEIEQGSDFVSREPCCGTHVLNTSDLQDFCVINLKSLGRSTASIQGVTGDRAKLARDNAEDLNEDLIRFKKSVEEHLDKPEMLEMAIISLKQRLNFQITDNTILPYAYKLKIMEELNAISRDIKGKTSDQLRDLVEMEMQDAIESNMQLTKSKKKYIIYYLRISTMLESVSLKRATALCSNIPVIVIAYSDNMVKARCCVPKELESEEFNAEKWLSKTVASVFKSKTTRQQLQDNMLVCNMKETKVHLQNWDNLLAESLEKAERFVNEKL